MCVGPDGYIGLDKQGQKGMGYRDDAQLGLV